MKHVSEIKKLLVGGHSTKSSFSRKASRSQNQQQQKAELKSSGEDTVLLHDIEDLLPPPPPIQLFSNLEEDSIRIDRSRLSLTPQPRVLRRKAVIAKPTAAALAPALNHTSGRVWLFEPAPPSFDELKATALNSGIDDVQVQYLFALPRFGYVRVC